MNPQPNAAASSVDFEFAALAEADNYRRALIQEFVQVLQGDVIEVGAGIGQITQLLAQLPAVRRALAVEPDPRFCALHRSRFPNHEILQGTAAALPEGTACDAILCVNVLEHIPDDRAELGRFAGLLRARHGALCLFVPARPEIYAPIDRDFGHFRRYKFGELKLKLTEAGFAVERLHYFNAPGYFAWWLNFCLLKKRVFEPGKVRAFDRWIFPLSHFLEKKIVRPPFGQSLLAIGRS